MFLMKRRVYLLSGWLIFVHRQISQLLSLVSRVPAPMVIPLEERKQGSSRKPSVNTVTVSVTKGLFEVVTETCLLWSPNAYLASGGKTYCIERDGGEQGLWVRLGLEYQL